MIFLAGESGEGRPLTQSKSNESAIRSCRKTVARYYDCISVMDKDTGRILRELEEGGAAENTIVFYFSDHGSGMPRHKRLLLDSGMHVPLLIRFPEKYRHLAPAAPGKSLDRLVSFVDFPATVLSSLQAHLSWRRPAI